MEMRCDGWRKWRKKPERNVIHRLLSDSKCGDTMKTLIDSERMSNQIIFKDTDFPNELNSLEHYPRSSKKTRLERF